MINRKITEVSESPTKSSPTRAKKHQTTKVKKTYKEGDDLESVIDQDAGDVSPESPSKVKKESKSPRKSKRKEKERESKDHDPFTL